MYFPVAILALLALPGARGHGALTKPMPRKVSGQEYCPWCVGEHQPVTNPYGAVHRDAVPSHPCMGSSKGDAHYQTNAFGSYTSIAEPGASSYTAGGSLEATIVLDADHNGDARFSYCPHSEDQTEDCFQQRPLTGWEDVHSYWGGDSTQDHWKSSQHFPQTVSLPADMTSGPVTIRWLWICKYTDEIFVSCFDTDIVGGTATTAGPTGSTTSTTTAPSSISQECIWTEPAGREVQRTPREQKDGRICWDYVVPSGTTVYYQSKTDIYTTWNAETCCLSAAGQFGSASDGEPNIVSFTSTIGSFGFCECTAWDPNNPGTSCAGEATAASMVCPVLGSTAGMCSVALTWDGIPVGCTPAYTGTTTAALSPTSVPSPAPSPTPAPAPTAGCCSWDAAKGCEQLDNAYCQIKENCEGGCNGNWLILSTTNGQATTITASISTTTTSSTTTPSTTTLSTTTLSATTPSTTTPSSTTPAAPTGVPPAGFEVVNGGVDQACRGSDSQDTSDSYYSVFSNMESLTACAAKCDACEGIEYSSSGRCEVWTRAIEASKQVQGYSCYRRVPSSTAPTHGSCGQLHDQCGGSQHYQGPTCCVSGLKCDFHGADYSQCIKDPSSAYACSQVNEQCGGTNWEGAQCCAQGLTCVRGNDFYSQCLRTPGSLAQAGVAVLSDRRLRGPRFRKAGKHAGALESKPWLVQQGSRVGKRAVQGNEEL